MHDVHLSSIKAMNECFMTEANYRERLAVVGGAGMHFPLCGHLL
jgi:hypothetical protein